MVGCPAASTADALLLPISTWPSEPTLSIPVGAVAVMLMVSICAMHWAVVQAWMQKAGTCVTGCHPAERSGIWGGVVAPVAAVVTAPQSAVSARVRRSVPLLVLTATVRWGDVPMHAAMLAPTHSSTASDGGTSPASSQMETHNTGTRYASSNTTLADNVQLFESYSASTARSEPLSCPKVTI